MHLVRLRDSRPDSARWHGCECLLARVPVRGEQVSIDGTILTVSAVQFFAFHSTPSTLPSVVAEITVH